MNNFMPEQQQSPVGTYHHCFADFAELASFVAAAKRLQLCPMEHSLTAAIGGFEQFGHDAMMEGQRKPYNCPKGQVFPDRNCP